MATYTPNWNLSKPENTDQQSAFISDYCGNMDIIDQHLGSGGGGGGIYGVFVDPSKIVVPMTAFYDTLSYTATEDCFISLYIITGRGDVFCKIDGQDVWLLNDGQVAGQGNLIPLRKGQILTITNAGTLYANYYIVYGLIGGSNPIFAPIIYSDTEREVGTWRDNKPLYAKTWVLTIPSATGTYTFNEATPNLENVVHTEYTLWGLGERGDVPWYNPATILFSEQTDTGIEFYFASNNYAGRKIYFTSYYTKTTDVAGSGNWNVDGVPTHHYSTNEQVVGTWTDGKPVYERTFNPSIVVGNNTIAHGITDLKECISITGRTKYNNTNEVLPLPYVSVASNFVICLGNVNASTFLIESGMGFSSFQDCFVTMRYTKTTD